MSPGAALAEGSLINNRYRILRLIGGGNMGRVYQVEHVELGTLHALKEQESEDGNTENAENAVKQALGEARLLSKLTHPGIPKVTDSFREDGRIYFVMDFIDGQNLKSILERNGAQPFDIATVLRWGCQICDVLAYLHSQPQPIIFRDIKPANLIRRPDGTISMVDFGIARKVRKGATSDTIVFGSPGYAPPEQWGQGQTDPRSDIYALGATLHHLLTGRDPSATPFQWQPLRQFNIQAPLVLERLIMKCLELEPNNRPKSAEEVLKALRYALQVYEEEKGDLTHPVDYRSGEFSPEHRQLAEKVISQAEDTAHPEAAVRTDRILSVPYSPASHPQPEMPFYSPQGSNAATVAPMRQFMFYLLLVSAIPILIGNVFYFPILREFVKPKVTITVPDRPAIDDGPDVQRAYTDALSKKAEQEQAEASFERMRPVQLMLSILTCVAFIFGVFVPMKPTRLGMVGVLAGILAMICMAGTIFYPDRPVGFAIVSLLIGLLLIPTLYLIATDRDSALG